VGGEAEDDDVLGRAEAAREALFDHRLQPPLLRELLRSVHAVDALHDAELARERLDTLLGGGAARDARLLHAPRVRAVQLALRAMAARLVPLVLLFQRARGAVVIHFMLSRGLKERAF
jgi:hypothetical protein